MRLQTRVLLDRPAPPARAPPAPAPAVPARYRSRGQRPGKATAGMASQAMSGRLPQTHGKGNKKNHAAPGRRRTYS